MSSLISDFFYSLLLPPGGNFIWLIVGFICLKKFKRTAFSLIFFATFSLLLFSMPWFSNSLMLKLESDIAINASQLKQFRSNDTNDIAIVVMSGGRLTQASEYGNIDVINHITLQRLEYTAWLHKKTQLPILLSGGSKLGEATSESVLMNQTMLASFNIAPKWIESKSSSTQESAYYSGELLKKQGITTVILVTHAWHMQRAKRAFQQQALKVIPAPTAFLQLKSQHTHSNRFFPNPEALQKSHLALREILNNLVNEIVDYYQ